jgi:hypothetical protein
MLLKLFFVKEYPTNKTLNTANKILMKKKKSNLQKNCQNLNSIVTLNFLTRKLTDKNNVEKRKYSNYLFKQNNSVAMVTIALPIIENIPI